MTKQNPNSTNVRVFMLGMDSGWDMFGSWVWIESQLIIRITLFKIKI